MLDARLRMRERGAPEITQANNSEVRDKNPACYIFFYIHWCQYLTSRFKTATFFGFDHYVREYRQSKLVDTEQNAEIEFIKVGHRQIKRYFQILFLVQLYTTEWNFNKDPTVFCKLHLTKLA